MVAILDFRSDWFRYFGSTSKCPDTSYQVSSQNGLSDLEKKFKIEFQDGGYGGHFGFWIWTVLAFFWSTVQVAQYFLASLESVDFLVQNRFSRWQPSWFLDLYDYPLALQRKSGDTVIPTSLSPPSPICPSIPRSRYLRGLPSAF